MRDYITSSRRDVLRTFGVGLASMGSIGSGMGVQTARSQGDTESWTQYGFDTRNTGHAPDHTAPAENIQTKWTYGDPMEPGVFTTPAIVDDMVYVAYADFIDSETGSLFALDADTGDEIWQFNVDDPPERSEPVVADDIVYFGTGDGSLDTNPSRLYAINKDTGEERWSYEIEGSIISSPKVDNGIVYFASHINDSGIYALDISSGTLEWFKETGNNFATPAVTDEVIYYVRNGLHAISKEDGSEIWSQTELQSQGSAPTVSNEKVFVGSRSEIGEELEDDDTAGLYALDVGSGEIVWHFETNGEIQSSPAVAEGLVIVGTRRPDEHIYAVDVEKGDEEWRYDVGDVRFQSPVIADTVVFVGDDQAVYALDLQTGEQLWEFTENGTNHSLAVANGTVYFGTNSGEVYALEGEARSNAPATVFQQAQNAAESPLAITGLGAAAVGLGYAAYRRFGSNSIESGSKDGSQHTTGATSNQTTDDNSSETITIDSYAAITLGEEITSDCSVSIQLGTANHNTVWVITPETGETISSEQASEFLDRITPWSRMDAHSNLLAVYGSGTDPLPWAAVEQAEYPELTDMVDSMSIIETCDALQQVCEALHHVHRYGTTYDNLTTNSVLYTDDDGVKLQGVLDQFEKSDPWYNAPKELDGESTEQSTVYRIGLIAYELLTGTLPYRGYPDGIPRQSIQSAERSYPSEQINDVPAELESIIMKALSKSPDERYETVLHLRDEFDSLDIS